jgi:hypothetical protein
MERTGAGPPPLFQEAYQTVPMLTGTAIVKLLVQQLDFLEANLQTKKATRLIIEWLCVKLIQINSSGE